MSRSGEAFPFAHVAETAVLAVVAGIAVGWTNLPAGLFIGALLAVAIAAIAGRPMHFPHRLVPVVMILIGVSLGSIVTPDMLNGIASYPVSVVMLVLAVIAVCAVNTLYLRTVHRWNWASAFLASVPGASTQALAAALDCGADVRAIAINQSVRVVIIAVCLPTAMALMGNSPKAAAVSAVAFSSQQWLEFAILLGLCVAAAFIAQRLHVPAAMTFGPLGVSAALHGSGLVHVTVPLWLSSATMIGLGAWIGSRFAGNSGWLLIRYGVAALGSFAVAGIVAGLFVVGVSMITTVNPIEATLAYAPGALEAMMLLAYALQMDPVFVGAHHLARFLFVSLALPVAIAVITKRRLAKGVLPRSGNEDPAD